MSNPSKPYLLLWIDTDPVSMEMVQYTKTMAGWMDTKWSALYIKTAKVLNDQEKEQLAGNLNLIRQCGGRIMSSPGSDPAKTCLETARRENITHIIVGKSGENGHFDHSKQKLINRMIEKSGKITIHVVGMDIATKDKRKYSISKISSKSHKYTILLFASLTLALLSITLADKTGYQFLPFVVLMALFIAIIILRINLKWLVAILAVYALGDLVIPPPFTFLFDISSNILSFLLFFAVAFLGGIIAIRFKEQQEQTVMHEKQTNALFLLTAKLGDATSMHEVVTTSMENIQKYFSVDAFFIFHDNDNQLTNRKYIPQGIQLSELEAETAELAFKCDQPTGRFTDISPSCQYTCYPLKGAKLLMGVAVVKLNEPFTWNEALFWDAFLSQISQAVEHQRLEQLARKTNLLDESDKLYKTLFNTISHELRIPVATIMGASDILLMNNYPEHIRPSLYREILEASQRLNRLIENLLNMSRLESGRIAVHSDWFDIFDLFNCVKESLEEELKPFRVVIVVPETMPMIRLDFGLMEQVVHNLMHNSSLYAAPGTTICLKASYENGHLVIEIMDRGGPAFEPEDIPHVFDKFWRYKDNKTGGLGLGLSIVKGFVEAHKGKVKVENRKTGGVRFTIVIPTEISSNSGK